MRQLIFLCCIMPVEIWGTIYFFDTFLGRKQRASFFKYRGFGCFVMLLLAVSAGIWIDMWKVPLVSIGYILLGRICYQAGWAESIFCSLLNYCMMFLIDLTVFCLADLWVVQRTAWMIQGFFGVLPARLCWIAFLILFRRTWKEGVKYGELTDSQLVHFRDMQAVYERQGRKMHDYKNQIRTMQVLLKEGDTVAAAALAERLTESISVEMSAVNTNHPVVNAVLNQKFHAAREQGISMIFKVGDMSSMRLDEEETVILLSNLLDNAIHACLKVVKAQQKAVIHVKLVQEGGKLIFSVRNPVTEKVQITDGIVLDSDGGMHGVGLMNVKTVVDKYGGDFAFSCDEEKFRAVVIL